MIMIMISTCRSKTPETVGHLAAKVSEFILYEVPLCVPTGIFMHTEDQN